MRNETKAEIFLAAVLAVAGAAYFDMRTAATDPRQNIARLKETIRDSASGKPGTSVSYDVYAVGHAARQLGPLCAETHDTKSPLLAAQQIEDMMREVPLNEAQSHDLNDAKRELLDTAGLRPVLMSSAGPATKR
jgi:hypothetical protein